MKPAAAFLAPIVACLALWGCAEDGDVQDDEDSAESGSSCTVTPPAGWSAPDWDANTTEALALRASLDTLVGTMRMAEEGMAPVDDVAQLEALFAAEHMGPDWAQALYRTAVFITKVA